MTDKIITKEPQKVLVFGLEQGAFYKSTEESMVGNPASDIGNTARYAQTIYATPERSVIAGF